MKRINPKIPHQRSGLKVIRSGRMKEHMENKNKKNLTHLTNNP
jgi:hypothetical protein